MKKILSLLLCLALLGSVAAAETVIDGGEARNIQIKKAGLNEAEAGVSPVTGLNLAEVKKNAGPGFAGQAVTGRYMPLLVQIDNADGGIGYNEKGKATGYRAPWGAQYTSAIYEAPLYKDGDTRLTFLFSDLIPDDVGPLRSARLFHAWLREEWDCGFIFYGQQELAATNVLEAFRETGADRKADGLLLFFGTYAANPWKQYFDVKDPLSPPHDKTVNAAALVSLIPANYEAPNHTWLFSDDLPNGGDSAEQIYVTWAKQGTPASVHNSMLEWNEDDEVYERYMYDSKGGLHPYQTLGIGGEVAVPITFNNVIVQFTDMEWVLAAQPRPTVTGTGNADYFMGGMHYKGVWQRDSLSDRTVFYDSYGEEIELQRGRTLIIVMDYAVNNRSIRYE